LRKEIYMRAAIVERFDGAPKFGEMGKPGAREGEILLTVKAAALSNLVRAQANGSHYSAGSVLPFVPGNDGVGVTAEGERVYFLSPRAPFGSMAEFTVVRKAMTLPLPETLSDEMAAALGNPGLATWGALLGRAKLVRGEVVLVNGATGVAGRQAVQVAKYLGASKVIATGRSAAALEEIRALGADEVVLLTQSTDDLVKSFRGVMPGVQVVLDYLWGASASALLEAAGGRGSAEGEPRIRFVQIGSISGESIALPAHLLRSSGVELLGSGLGSLSSKEILSSLAVMFEATTKAEFTVDVQAVPLKDVETAWGRDTGDRRVVFLP
jgi:NADPH:quinone reductase-like Zn-dependent oxidoreductase